MAYDGSIVMDRDVIARFVREDGEQLGSGSHIQELAAANGRTIADTIHPGQVLMLPE